MDSKTSLVPVQKDEPIPDHHRSPANWRRVIAGLACEFADFDWLNGKTQITRYDAVDDVTDLKRLSQNRRQHAKRTRKSHS